MVTRLGRSPRSRAEPRDGPFPQPASRRIEGFDESLRFGEDVDYFLRLQEIGMRISLCDVDGLVYRRHATNSTDDQRAVQNSVFDVLKRRLARAGGATDRRLGEHT